MTSRASGPFDVKIIPQPAAEGVGDPAIGRMALDKRFHGELDAVSKGEMLGIRPGPEGSGGYVAMERVEGTLHGRRGGFALQHHATMTRGTPDLTIVVVPGSGTGELGGIEGTMGIVVADGRHSYDFEYTLPDAG